MTTTPGRDALIEAMRLEQARIYGTTQRQLRDESDRVELTPDTPANIARRRAVLAQLDESSRVVLLREHRARKAAAS